MRKEDVVQELEGDHKDGLYDTIYLDFDFGPTTTIFKTSYEMDAWETDGGANGGI